MSTPRCGVGPHARSCCLSSLCLTGGSDEFAGCVERGYMDHSAGVMLHVVLLGCLQARPWAAGVWGVVGS